MISAMKEFYGKYLSSQENSLIDCEIERWIRRFQDIEKEDKPSITSDVLAVCNAKLFPAIHKIISIFLTIPVGSVS